MPRKKIQPRPRQLQARSGQHRTLVYVDDDVRDGGNWTWWCLDCPETGPAPTSKGYADKTAKQHREKALCTPITTLPDPSPRDARTGLAPSR